jgi:hypothetical protein
MDTWGYRKRKAREDSEMGRFRDGVVMRRRC